jgi:putative NIF3 family GTP cyclohydrolase 1 type 2
VQSVALPELVRALDALFELDRSEPDLAMRRHLPRVYEQAGRGWREWMTPTFAERFNGLMIEGAPTVRRVFAATFPSAEVLDRWIPRSLPGDVLITHHPIDCRNGTPPDKWAAGFVAISPKHIRAVQDRQLSIYACHVPMDISWEVGTTASMVEALGGEPESSFWPYGPGYAGQVCRVTRISRDELVANLKRIFAVDRVEVAGVGPSAIERIAVVAGIGDHVTEMETAERLGAQAYVTGEIHVRIEGEYGRTKLAEVQRFARRTSMILAGVSHAASEHLVMETQLARWLLAEIGMQVQPIREERWWR